MKPVSVNGSSRIPLCSWPAPGSTSFAGETLWRVILFDEFPTFRLTLDIGPPKEDVHRDLFEVEVAHDEQDQMGTVLGLKRIHKPFMESEQRRIRWFLGEVRADEDLDESAFSRPTLKRLITSIRTAEPEPGRVVVGSEALEVYRLLGEPLPWVWPTAAFLAWADGLG